MVSISVWILTLAVAAGTGLVFWHLRATEGTRRLPIGAGIAHGTLGVIGLGLLLLALRGPARGVDTGVAAFGTESAALFAAAALTGILMWWLRRKAIVMAVHAGIAITGYVLLLAWSALG